MYILSPESLTRLLGTVVFGIGAIVLVVVVLVVLVGVVVVMAVVVVVVIALPIGLIIIDGGCF